MDKIKEAIEQAVNNLNVDDIIVTEEQIEIISKKLIDNNKDNEVIEELFDYTESEKKVR